MTVHGERPSFLIAALGELAKARFGEVLEPYGIRPGHFGVLRRVAEQQGASQQEIADQMRVRRSVMVGLVDDLEEAGLLLRERSTTDRRAHALRLTAAGRRLLPRLNRISDQLDDEVLAALPLARRATFRRDLQSLGAAAGLDRGVYPHADPDAHEGDVGVRPPSTTSRTRA